MTLNELLLGSNELNRSKDRIGKLKFVFTQFAFKHSELCERDKEKYPKFLGCYESSKR